MRTGNAFFRALSCLRIQPPIIALSLRRFIEKLRRYVMKQKVIDNGKKKNEKLQLNESLLLLMAILQNYIIFYREIDKCEIMICLKFQKVKKLRENGMTNRQSVYNKNHYRSYSSGYSTLFCGVAKIEEVTVNYGFFLILYL